MADAQDLKFSKSHFLTASRDFFSHVFQPLFTSLFSILAWFRRTPKTGGFPTPKVAQKVAQKSFKTPTNWKIRTGLSPRRVRLFFAFLRLCHFWVSAQQITCSHQEIYNYLDVPLSNQIHALISVKKIFEAILLCHFFNAKNWRRFFMPNDLFETVFCVPVRIHRRSRGDEIRLWLLGWGIADRRCWRF